MGLKCSPANYLSHQNFLRDLLFTILHSNYHQLAPMFAEIKVNVISRWRFLYHPFDLLSRKIKNAYSRIGALKPGVNGRLAVILKDGYAFSLTSIFFFAGYNART